MGLKEELDVMEGKIAQLKVDYEQYFARVVRKEPVKLREEIDKFIFTNSNKNITNTSLRFRLNSVTAKYNTYKQYWNRILKMIEDGTYKRSAEGAGLGGAPEVVKHPVFGVVDKNKLLGEDAVAPEAAPQAATQAARPAAPQQAKPKNEIEDIYNQFINARKSTNESTTGLSMDTLAKTIEQAKKKVQEQFKTKDVELKVLVKDGKAKLSIVPKK